MLRFGERCQTHPDSAIPHLVGISTFNVVIFSKVGGVDGPRDTSSNEGACLFHNSCEGHIRCGAKAPIHRDGSYLSYR